MSLEARRNAQRGLGSSAVSSVLNPVNGIRDDRQRRGLPVRDHAKENRQRLKQVQDDRVAKEEAEQQQAQAELFKLTKFKNVESKPVKTSQDEFGEEGASSSSRQFLKRESVVQPPAPTEPYVSQKVKTKPAVPRLSELPEQPLLPRASTNHINANAKKVIETKPQRKPEVKKGDPTVQNPDYGKVPKYLVDKRIKEAELAEARKKESENECPAGFRLMPEDERLETLKMLKESQDRLMKEYQKLPIVCDTPSLRQKKQTMETKMDEVKNAIEVFSKPTVYVQQD